MGRTRDDDVDFIPMFINTLENCYKSIKIIGEDNEAQKIVSYLKENDNIQVWDKNDEEYRRGTAAELNLFVNNEIQVSGKSFSYGIEHGKLIGQDILNTYNDIYQNIVPQLLRHGVRVIAVRTPNFWKYKNKIRLFISMEKYRLISKYHRNSDELILRHFGNIGLNDEFKNTKADTSKGYVRVFGNGQYINYDDGFRRIPCGFSVTENSSRIFLFGFCVAANPMLSDTKTVGANLQKLLGKRYRVYSRSNDSTSVNLIMRSLRYREGDIVVLFNSRHDIRPIELGIETLDLTDSYNAVPELWKHISDSSFHFDEKIALVLAKGICRVIATRRDLEQIHLKNKDLYFGPLKKRCPRINMYGDGSLIAYVKGLLAFAGGYCGAIVMNCNPFTLGHRFLIEKASERVDHLYVFVVEEDKSEFRFEDRFQMVKRGVSELGNVSVHPSGEYILSANTLPGYFNKKHLGNISFSANQDIELFAAIAKELHISVRFVGTEPKDGFTRKYNLAMCELLPQYGIEVVEIPRLNVDEKNGDIISATTVRMLLDKQMYQELKKYLPYSTMEILREKGYIRAF